MGALSGHLPSPAQDKKTEVSSCNIKRDGWAGTYILPKDNKSVFKQESASNMERWAGTYGALTCQNSDTEKEFQSLQ